MTDVPADLSRIEDAMRKGAGRRDLMRWLGAAGMGAVMANGLGRDGDIPGIGMPVIEKYLDDLELIGLLDRR